MDRVIHSLIQPAGTLHTHAPGPSMLGARDIKINTTRFSPQPHKFDK